jgi:Arc/MetJ family transcription regulator
MGTAIESPEERLRVRVGGSVAGSQRRVIPGYTVKVKTAISVPDETFEQASRQAAELGISRSEFFARAARRYLDELASRSLTQQVNEALTAAGDDDSAAAAAQAGRRRLAAGDEW